MKSDTICDPSQNQIFPIEAIEIQRPLSSQSESELTRADMKRPGTASSFATFPSRRPIPNRNENNVRREYDNSDTEDEDQENEKLTNLDDDNVEVERYGRTSIKIYEHDIDGETVTVTDETVSSIDDIFVETNENEQSPETTLDDNTDRASENDISNTAEEATNIETNVNEQAGNEALSQTEVSKTNEKPSSEHSSKSSKSKSTFSSRRSNVVTPLSKVTLTSSVGSRASTVKRIKSLLRSNIFNNSKMNTDTDKVKALRMKMLDINTVKYTLVTLIITIVFMFSFLSYLSLVIWRYVEDDNEVNFLTDTGLVFFQIEIRSVFLNSSLNPVIYGGFNSKFRAFFYNTCCSCCLTSRRKRKKRTQTRDHSDSTSVT